MHCYCAFITAGEILTCNLMQTPDLIMISVHFRLTTHFQIELKINKKNYSLNAHLILLNSQGLHSKAGLNLQHNHVEVTSNLDLELNSRQFFSFLSLVEEWTVHVVTIPSHQLIFYMLYSVLCTKY